MGVSEFVDFLLAPDEEGSTYKAWQKNQEAKAQPTAYEAHVTKGQSELEAELDLQGHRCPTCGYCPTCGRDPRR